MIIVKDMVAEDLLAIQVQAAQAGGPVIDAEHARVAATSGPSISGVDDKTGEVIFCAGASKVWNRRWLVWCVLSASAARHMLRVTRVMESMLGTLDGRIEAIVDPAFGAGHKWMDLLGFEVDNPLAEKFLPDGSDATIYVRFN